MKIIFLFYMAVAAIVLISSLLIIKNIVKRENKYDVFHISENQLTILAGIPVTYSIDTIEELTFSKMRGKYGGYTDIIRVIKTNGHKSRPFLFDGSAYYKKFMFLSSEKDIDLAIIALMKELKKYRIPCREL
ncbi:MAG: hypothetical protein MSP55_03310 [Fusobacterium necrophorum]|nr:hypothetical protein [Fusobacterium necrophorum]